MESSVNVRLESRELWGGKPEAAIKEVRAINVGHENTLRREEPYCANRRVVGMMVRSGRGREGRAKCEAGKDKRIPVNLVCERLCVFEC